MNKGTEDKGKSLDKDETEFSKKSKTIEDLASLTTEQLEIFSNILSGKKEIKQQRKIILPFSKEHIKIGVVSDTHMTGMFFNKKCLDYLYHLFKEEGAEFVVHAGDITDGEQMHKGHQNHLRVMGIDKAVELVANEYPDIGLQTRFIIGNHDYSFYKQNGGDIGIRIAEKRKDMIYVGKHELEMGFEGDIPLGKKATLRLLHPGKGTAKGLSYQPQGIIEGLESESKPKILIIGHYHKMDYILERNVHTFQSGTTEDQSEWMRTKNIQAHLGGFLLDVYLNKEGTIDRLKYRDIRGGW